MSKPHIRPARAEDMPGVIELIRGLAAFESLPGPDASAEARLKADFATSPAPFGIIVADLGGKLVGYALHFETYSTFLGRRGLWLEDLFVLPDARGLGIGTALLREIAQVARVGGFGRLEWSVLDWNTGAQSLYRRLGAEILPDWRICRVEGGAIATFASRTDS